MKLPSRVQGRMLFLSSYFSPSEHVSLQSMMAALPCALLCLPLKGDCSEYKSLPLSGARRASLIFNAALNHTYSSVTLLRQLGQ